MAALFVGAPLAALASPAQTSAGTGAQDQAWAAHGQFTNIWQDHPSFRSPYAGAQSLPGQEHATETTDATLFLGVRLWRGAEFWVDPEINQGIAPGDTLGAAGFVNGDGAKVGKIHPYFRVQRGFLRQTVDLGGEPETTDPDQNQLGGSRSPDRIVITVGKFNVTDIFDDNAYAHDVKTDFLNWSVIDSGSFDYAADAWGYSYGAAAEWRQGRWTLRGGAMALSRVPNGKDLTPMFGQFQLLGEIEERHAIAGRDGKLKLTLFESRGRMGTYAAALARAALTGTAPDTASVRRYRGRFGAAVNLEQALTEDLGLFARIGADQGDVESYEYTDIDNSWQAGLSLKGGRWGRKDDAVGVAGVVNEISPSFRTYLNAGGLGILVGDGKLPHYGAEQIVEAYYSAALVAAVHVTLDMQWIENPAYNRDRGPVAMFGARLHAAF